MKSLFAFFFSILILFTGCTPSPEHYTFTGRTMGTGYSITISSSEKPPLDLSSKIEIRLKEISQQMSTWDKDSEISLFNHSHKTDWQKISDDFHYVTKKSLNISRITNGAFDPTVMPIVRLWGFSSYDKTDRIPENDEIKKTVNTIGYQNIQLKSGYIRKSAAAIELDLSAIAKGFGVDAISELIRNNGYKSFMVEIGGEVKAEGVRHNGEPWRVGIRNPKTDRIEARLKLSLTDKAIATSGDYENYFLYQNKKYSHVINPKTGYPPENRIASVSVIADDCMTADAIATALMVMNVDDGLKLAKENGYAIAYILRNDNKFTDIFSDNFKHYLLN